MFEPLPNARSAAQVSGSPVPTPDSIGKVREPRGPVTAEDLARGTIQVEGEPINDNPIITFGIFDRLEWRSGEGRDGYVFDGFAFTGGDYNRLWIELEGEGKFDGNLEAAEVQVLYSRAVTSYWNVQVGFRHDFKPEPELTYGVVGFEGLNFYWTGIETNLYVSEDGDVSADFEVEYDEFLTQRLVLQPRFELAAQAQDVEKLGLGSGVTDYEVGLRLRYEIQREFAPYIGVSWTETVGETADMLAPDEDAGTLSAVAGLRIWF
ncbi:copper resistance protein B [uncultured Jannaschia sp.]|uniref:copper resistance protein B n=1 Tax=uncultured Jannaschia sp. TaxID=293347 RepID=UPI00261FCB14|nr:copper resistance protein B [uncultured Jannaschia sp.]